MAKIKNTKEKILNGGSGGATTVASTPLAEDRVPSLKAANPEPTLDDMKATPQLSQGWAGASPQQGADELPGMTLDQVNSFSRDLRSSDQIGKVAGLRTPSLSDDVKKGGVYAGSPEALQDVKTLNDINERLRKNDEDAATIEKRKKRNALFSAIGDGVAALSNLWFTTKGSPSADQSKTMSKAVQDTYEKEQALLERHRDKLLDNRARVLAQQRMNWYNHEQLKIRQQMADAQQKYQEARSNAERKRAEDYMKYLTQRNEILADEKEAEKKRADERAKHQNAKEDAVGAAAKTRSEAYASRIANQNYNNDRNTTDQIRKRQGRAYNPANDPGMVKVVEKDRVTGSTKTRWERKEAPKPKPTPKPAPKKKLKKNTLGL